MRRPRGTRSHGSRGNDVDTQDMGKRSGIAHRGNGRRPWATARGASGLALALAWICALPLHAASEYDLARAPSGTSGHEIRGVVKARSEAVISSQIDARLIELPFQLGDPFEKGDTLVAFDCAMLEAELAAARAELRSSQKTHENNLELAQLDAIGALEVELSQAEAEKARAQVLVARVQTRRCTIKAPYAGRVVATNVNVFESVRASQELLRILDDRSLELELIVPSHWVRWLEAGTAFRFRVDETSEEIPAEVLRVGASADPVSQTIRLQAGFPDATGKLLAGMSGTAVFAPEDANAVPAELAP